MKRPPITPEYDYEDIEPADLIDGISTLEGTYSQGAIIDPPGEGPDRLQSWAIQEVEQATSASDVNQDDVPRIAANAIINARRSLSCLVDWYLERDLATKCASPPSTAKQKADFLVARGIIDRLTASVLERAVAKRNEIEHRYEAATLETAQDFVELIRRTSYAITNESDPSHAPWIFGFFASSYGVGKDGEFAEVHGLTSPLVVLQRFASPYWVGILLPKGNNRAVIRRAYHQYFSPKQLVTMLSILEQRFGKPTSFSSENGCKLMASAMQIV